MNKLYILIIPFLLLLNGCWLQVADYKDLHEKVDGRMYLRGDSKPYNGQAVMRYKDKHQDQEMCYKDGLLHGVWKLYFANGELSVLGVYKEGKSHGKWRLYYEDGKILAEEGYLNGNKNGRNRYFSNEGVLIEEVNYVDGELHGSHKIWDGDGAMISETHYVKGEKQ